MKKEIIGILFFFMVVFSLISLLSFDPGDPCLFFNAGGGGKIQNLFGVLRRQFRRHSRGAVRHRRLLGALSLPVGQHPFLRQEPGAGHVAPGCRRHPADHHHGQPAGLSAGPLCAFWQPLHRGRHRRHPLKAFAVRYSNPAGGSIILMLVWLIGFIMATGFSVVAFYRRCKTANSALFDRLATV
jgi:S-DNA-T family DNA segregation ATPase FtsK/SpoIIIE